MSKQSKRLKRKLRKKARQRFYWETAQDEHHLLYQRKFWQKPYAKLLREHKYMRRYIPKYTLHKKLHDTIHDIPVPNEPECRAAYNELIRREREGLIDVEYDTIEQRLDFLIEMWGNKCPATVETLRWQQEVVRKFYEGR